MKLRLWNILTFRDMNPYFTLGIDLCWASDSIPDLHSILEMLGYNNFGFKNCDVKLYCNII